MPNRNSWFLRGIAHTLIFILLMNMSSCYYYTFKRDTAITAEKLDQLKNSPNYLIIHYADQAYNLKNIRLDQQAQQLSGVLQPLTADHMKYLTTKDKPGSANRYKKRLQGRTMGSPGVVHEVHLYLKSTPLKEGEILIPLSEIEKVDVYDPHTGATTASWIFGTLGVAAGTYLIVGLIVLALKSSCPFVYVNNGEEFVFAGEIYSGAIFKSTERDDYLVLPKITTGEMIELQVANKLKEQQFINQLEILNVTHPSGSKIIPDRKGGLHKIAEPVQLIKAVVGSEDITEALVSSDSMIFFFNDESGKDRFNDVTVTFPKKNKAKEGHLVVNTKNTLFGDYVVGEFTKLFGSEYTEWIKKQDEKPADPSRKWAIEQGLVMNVYVEINGRWKYVDFIDMVGPLAYRDVVVPIDLTQHEGETVKVKLSSGFMFWEADYVAMDYSTDADIKVEVAKAQYGVTNYGEDILTAVAGNDQAYLTQRVTGDVADFKFKAATPGEGFVTTSILHSRGYYHHVRDYEGPADKAELLRFKLPGRFSNFSWEKYHELNQLMQEAEVSVIAANK